MNMMAAQAAALTYHWTRFTVTGEVEVQRGNSHRGLVPYAFFPCTDGWIAIAVANNRQWSRLRSALDLDDHPHLRTNALRITHRAEVDDLVTQFTQQRSMAIVDDTLTAVGVSCGIVQRIEEVIAHPAVAATTVDHPVLGRISLPGPSLITATTRTEHTAPPLINAQEREILGQP